MKKCIAYLISGLCVLSIAGCKKDDKGFSTKVSAVQTLFYPADNSAIDLSQTSSVLFQWDQARAEDGGLVLYTLVFDKPGGDFSHPVFSVASDQNGLENKATISKATLNTIAQGLGVEPLESTQLIWTVLSSKGINAMMADSSRTITVKRALGIDNPPAQLYITGSATEGGTDLSKAIQLKLTGSGKYEIYTSLKPGTYHFVDNITGNAPNQFYLSGDTIHEGAGEVTVAGNAAQPYKIDLDFSSVSDTIRLIKSVDFWYCSKNDFEGKFTYRSNGVWELDNYKVVFTDMGGWTDNRHKYRVTLNDGTNDSYQWWGNSDHEGGNPPTAGSPASFYYLYPADDTQWNYGFKFPDNSNGKEADIQLIFSPDVASYTHTVTIH